MAVPLAVIGYGVGMIFAEFVSVERRRTSRSFPRVTSASWLRKPFVTYFDVLGISQDANDREVQTAYRRLAKQFHPDQHPGANAAEKDRLSAAMARINEAHAVLADPMERARYCDWLVTERVRSTSRPPNVDECVLCGSGPAASLRFEYQNAWLLRATSYKSEGNFCRDCARAFGRSQQNRTLWTGWWGFISFFRNFLVVARNAHSLWLAGRLGPPTPHSDVAAPLTVPLSAGKPLAYRSGAWVAAATIAVVLAALGTSAGDPDRFGPASPEADDTVAWENGACVTGFAVVTPVDCSGPHDGEVIDMVSDEASCPYAADGFVEDRGVVFCIDHDA